MIDVQPSQQNQYLIKSLLKNQIFTLDKQDSLKYQQITAQQCNQQFHWTIVSVDQLQNFTQKYSLRFGEFIQITASRPQNQNQPLSKVPLLIQQPDNSIISEQTFTSLNDNLVRKQPCVLQRADDNFYLTIEKDKIIFIELPNQGSYFQIIPLSENELEINRPIIQFQYEYEIRNYYTGYSLNIKQENSIPNHLKLSAIRSNKQSEKWQIIQDQNFHNQFQILNLRHQIYINTKDDNTKQFSVNPQNVNWEFQSTRLTIQISNWRSKFSYGVPFIIQNSSTKYFQQWVYLTQKYYKFLISSQIKSKTKANIIMDNFQHQI